MSGPKMSTTNENSNSIKHVHAGHAVEVLQKLQLISVRENNDSLCDVVLVAGKNKQRVRGHRAVLAACSPYFDALFTTAGMLESTAPEVTLGDDIHGNFLLPLIKFCYTGEIEISAATVDELVLTASRLQLNAVVSGCCEFMERNLDPSNCLGVASIATLLSLSTLKQEADKYAWKHFVQVCQQEEFLKLNIDQLKHLIASDKLRVPSEETVFRSVLSWVHYEMDDNKRSEHIPALLTLVRLSLLPLLVLADNVLDLCQKNACIPLFKEALQEKNAPIRSRRIKPRKSVESNILAVWWDDEKQGINVAEYSLLKDEWNLFGKTFSYREFFAAAFFNNELIVMGGRDSNQTAFDIVESINLDTMALSNLPSMTQKRPGLGIAVLDGLLYAAGGYIKGRGLINSVERFDPKDSKWSDVAPLSVGKCNFGLAVLDGRLYAVGGNADIFVLNSTECYDPQTDKWTMLANLNISRECLGIASGNVFLYAVGGKNDTGSLKSIERYDAHADKWTEICSLSSPRSIVDCVLLDNCLLILSWHDKKASLEEYNLVTDTWTERTQLLIKKVTYLRAVLK